MRILALVLVSFLLACDASQPAKPVATEISQKELMSQRPGSSLVLDVRTPEEYAAGHIKNAFNIPHDRLAEQLPKIQRYANAPVVVYCKSGRRAGLAAETLAQAGFTNVQHLTGDMDGWKAAGLPVATDGP